MSTTTFERFYNNTITYRSWSSLPQCGVFEDSNTTFLFDIADAIGLEEIAAVSGADELGPLISLWRVIVAKAAGTLSLAELVEFYDQMSRDSNAFAFPWASASPYPTTPFNQNAVSTGRGWLERVFYDLIFWAL